MESAVKTHYQGIVVGRTKTRKSVRTVDLDAGTVAVPTEHRARQEVDCGDAMPELVFPARDGKVIRPTYLLRQVKGLGARAGIPDLTFHSLRHFHATLSLQRRQNPVVVSRRLGHSNLSITMENYGHVLPGWQKNLADDFAEAMDNP